MLRRVSGGVGIAPHMLGNSRGPYFADLGKLGRGSRLPSSVCAIHLRGRLPIECYCITGQFVEPGYPSICGMPPSPPRAWPHVPGAAARAPGARDAPPSTSTVAPQDAAPQRGRSGRPRARERRGRYSPRDCPNSQKRICGAGREARRYRANAMKMKPSKMSIAAHASTRTPARSISISELPCNSALFVCARAGQSQHRSGRAEDMATTTRHYGR
jgi:hypothetical protein